MERQIVRDKVTLDHDGYIIPVEEYELSAEEMETVMKMVNESNSLVELCVAIYVEGRQSVLADEDFDRDCLFVAIMSKLKRINMRKLKLVSAFTSGLV